MSDLYLLNFTLLPLLLDCFLIVSLSRPHPQVRRFRVLEHRQAQIQREEHDQADSDGKNN